MEASDRQPKFWSNIQTYTMAGVCLILGVVMGYLVHAPAESPNCRRIRKILGCWHRSAAPTWRHNSFRLRSNTTSSPFH